MFICKHNVFRSRVAEEYMKKINPNHEISSAGLIKFSGDLHPIQKEVCGEFDLIFTNQSETMSVEKLKEQDIIITVADDVPEDIFFGWDLKDKLRIWRIKDIYPSNMSKEGVRSIIGEIIKKVDELNEESDSKE